MRARHTPRLQSRLNRERLLNCGLVVSSTIRAVSCNPVLTGSAFSTLSRWPAPSPISKLQSRLNRERLLNSAEMT